MHVTFMEPDSLSGRTSPEKLFHFFIGNGGTRNGVSRELLRALLGKLHAVYMPEAKDFCFASVLGASRAQDVFRRSGVCVQGSCKKRDLAHLVNPALMKGPPLHLYLSLVDCIPSVLLGDESSGRETDTHPHLPPGLLLVLEFVSQREEEELVQYLGSVGAGHGREGTQCSSKLCGWSSAGGSNGPSCEPDYRVKSKEMLDSDTASCSKVRHVLTPNSEQLQTRQVLTESSSTELRVVPSESNTFSSTGQSWNPTIATKFLATFVPSPSFPVRTMYTSLHLSPSLSSPCHHCYPSRLSYTGQASHRDCIEAPPCPSLWIRVHVRLQPSEP